MNRVGPITAGVKPTVEAIDALLDDRYEVRASKDGRGAQVLHQGKVVLDVFPYEDGSRIFRAVATTAMSCFPGVPRWGIASATKFWDQMKCVLEPHRSQRHAAGPTTSAVSPTWSKAGRGPRMRFPVRNSWLI